MLFKKSSPQILFEDADLICIDKPSGLPTHPTLDPLRPNGVSWVKQMLAQRKGIAPVKGEQAVYLGVHHRLDRDTSGVLLFTKTKLANKGIAELFMKRRIKKTYWALATFRNQNQLKLAQQWPSAWVEENYLGPCFQIKKKVGYGRVASGGLWAKTKFQLLQRGQLKGTTIPWFFIQAQPVTGRTHQIRVHLSEKGIPVLGDALYGGRLRLGQWHFDRICLHAAQIQFLHPLTQKEVKVSSPLPTDFRIVLEVG